MPRIEYVTRCHGHIPFANLQHDPTPVEYAELIFEPHEPPLLTDGMLRLVPDRIRHLLLRHESADSLRPLRLELTPSALGALRLTTLVFYCVVEGPWNTDHLFMECDTLCHLSIGACAPPIDQESHTEDNHGTVFEICTQLPRLPLQSLSFQTHGRVAFSSTFLDYIALHHVHPELYGKSYGLRDIHVTMWYEGFGRYKGFG